MENVIQKKFDIFIAFHGDGITGSQNEAIEVYNFLSKQTFDGRKLNIYLHPITNPGGRFGDTPNIVQNSSMFILVANDNIPREPNGTVLKLDSDGLEKRLFQELKAFSESNAYRSNPTTARVICCRNLRYMEAEKLYFMFNGCEHYRKEDVIIDTSTTDFAKTNIYAWIKCNLEPKNQKNENNPTNSYVKSANEISSVPADKVSIKTKDIPYYTSFIIRKDKLEKIDEILSSDNFLILSSKIRGIGLNTLAKNYIKTQNQKYKYVHYIQGANSIREMILGITFVNYENFDTLPQDLQFEEKCRLFKQLDSSTIILLADYNNDFDSDNLFYEIIANCKCKILITSQYSSKSYPCLQIGNMSNDDLIALFRYYCNANYSDEQLIDFFDKVYHHSSTIYLVANLIESSDLELDEVANNLLDIDEKVVSIENRKTDTINNHLLNVFNLSKKLLSDEEIKVLQILSLFDVNGVERKHFLDFYPEYKEAIDKLINIGHVFLSEDRPRKIFLPVFISDLIYRNFKSLEEEYNMAIDLIINDKSTFLSQIDFHNSHCRCYEFINNQRMTYKNAKTAILINQTAMHYYYLAQYQKALQTINSAFEFIDNKNDFIIQLIISKTMILEEMGIYNEAYDLLNSCIKDFNLDEIINLDSAIIHNLLGSIYRRLGKYNESIKMHLKAKDILLKLQEINTGNEKDILINLAISYNDLGSSYEKLRQDKEAYDSKNYALSLRKEILPDNHPDLAKSYNNVGNSLNHLHRSDEAIELIQKSIEIRSKILPSIHPDLAKSYNNLGYAYRHVHEYEKSLECYDKAIEINKNNKYVSLANYTYSFYFKSFVLSEIGQNEKALEVIDFAISLMEKTNYNYDLMEEYERKIDICLALNKIDDIKKLIPKLEKLYKECGKNEKIKDLYDKYCY